MAFFFSRQAYSRIRSEIQRQRVITMNGNDVTHAFELGAEHALALCKQHNIHFALLKEGSPSCGNKQVHDGNFQHRKVPGQGITTRKLKQHGIQVFNENELNILLKLIQENVKMHPFQV